jgi:hypothetical protein
MPSGFEPDNVGFSVLAAGWAISYWAVYNRLLFGPEAHKMLLNLLGWFECEGGTGCPLPAIDADQSPLHGLKSCHPLRLNRITGLVVDWGCVGTHFAPDHCDKWSVVL